jgi:hypothetical protein
MLLKIPVSGLSDKLKKEPAAFVKAAGKGHPVKNAVNN